MHSNNLRRTALAAICLIMAAAQVGAQTADGWISHAEFRSRTPVVLHFRRELELQRLPASLPVQVTADNRFILYVNGARVASGPSTGSIMSWRYSTVDIGRNLRRGHNVIAAVVWNFGEVAPMAQMSVATGFRLIGEGISTRDPGWRVKLDPGHGAASGHEQLSWQYYVASAPETIDANRADWNWAGDKEVGEGWQDAEPAPEAAARTLVADKLPAQTFMPAPPGTVVRSSLPRRRAFSRTSPWWCRRIPRSNY